MSARDALEYAALRAALPLASALPLGTAQRIATAAARAVFDRGGRRARWTLANLRIAFPERTDAELREIGRRSYANAAWVALDFLRAARFDDDDVRARISFVGLENLREELARGRGAFGVTAHFGSWELAARAVSLAGIPISAVSRPLRNSLFDAYLRARRVAGGLETIPHRRAVPGMLRALRRNRCLFVLNDQYSRRARGVFVPLFGVRCSTSAGVATLALRSGAPVLPMHVLRDAPDHHVATIEPPIAFEPSGERAADVAELTARCNAALEAFIRKHPEHWMWGHRRFRHSPDLDRDPYA